MIGIGTYIKSTQAIQDKIIESFQALAGDRESMLHYIMELGDKMPPLAEKYKTEHNVIKGCMSTVWLTYKKQGDQLFFEADSNTAITKGLVSLLISVLSGQRINDILHTNIYFVDRIGMSQLIGSQRSSGFASMLKQLRIIAMAQQAKMNQNRQ